MSGWEILDLRTLADQWQEAIDEIGDDSAAPPDEYVLEREQIESFEALCSELGCDPTPDGLRSYGENYEPTLIHEDYFEIYAQELAEDIGAIPRDAQWPLYCIDWERAADDLRQDYTSLTYDNATYLTRSA